MSAWLALDLGSTYTKCMRIDPARGVLEARDEKTPPNIAALPTRYEIDAEAYYRGATALLMGMITPEVAGVILSTQMHGYVIADGDFRPITPYVSWRDRAATEGPYPPLTPEDMGPSGVPLKPNLAMLSLHARLRTGLRLPDGARFCTLGGYIIGRMTGEHVCHIANAAPTGMADVRGGCWRRALIDKAGLSRLVFPAVMAEYTPVGVWRVHGRALTVMPDVGDHQVCALGAALPEETGLHVNIGTAGLVGMVTRRWQPGPYELRPWLAPGVYLQSVSGLPGGLALAARHAEIMAETGLMDAEVWRRMTDTCGLNPAAALYAQMAAAYRNAAAGMNLAVEQVGFSGGAALKNGALRAAILSGLGNAAGLSDVAQGLVTLAAWADNAKGKG